MYPSDLAAISQGDLRATQSARLVALIDRLRSVDVEFWRRKLADTPEIRSLARRHPVPADDDEGGVPGNLPSRDGGRADG